MGRQAKQLSLTQEERASLETGYKSDTDIRFSHRCHIILLKTTGKTSQEIGELLCVSDQKVNKWVKRYEAKGIDGLRTRKGQGRRPILIEADLPAVREAVAKERQRIGKAKSDLEKTIDKSFSVRTLQRFLKDMVQDGSA